MGVLKISFPALLEAFMDHEAERQATTVSEYVRQLVRQEYLASLPRNRTTVGTEDKHPSSRGPGRPPKPKMPPAIYPTTNVSLEPADVHVVMWDRAGPEVWDVISFPDWLDREYPADPVTGYRPYPDVADAELRAFDKRMGWK